MLGSERWSGINKGVSVICASNRFAAVPMDVCVAHGSSSESFLFIKD